MPALVGPALPAGTLRTIEQPRVTVDDELALRPWHPDDAAMLMAAFAQPDIQRWHMRRMDSEDEAREWVSGWARRWDRETDAGWAIARADDDNAVGYAALRTLASPVPSWCSARRSATQTRPSNGEKRHSHCSIHTDAPTLQPVTGVLLARRSSRRSRR